MTANTKRKRNKTKSISTKIAIVATKRRKRTEIDSLMMIDIGSKGMIGAGAEISTKRKRRREKKREDLILMIREITGGGMIE